jgi:hypothetical protein
MEQGVEEHKSPDIKKDETIKKNAIELNVHLFSRNLENNNLEEYIKLPECNYNDEYFRKYDDQRNSSRIKELIRDSDRDRDRDRDKDRYEGRPSSLSGKQTFSDGRPVNFRDFQIRKIKYPVINKEPGKPPIYYDWENYNKLTTNTNIKSKIFLPKKIIEIFDKNRKVQVEHMYEIFNKYVVPEDNNDLIKTLHQTINKMGAIADVMLLSEPPERIIGVLNLCSIIKYIFNKILYEWQAEIRNQEYIYKINKFPIVLNCDAEKINIFPPELDKEEEEIYDDRKLRLLAELVFYNMS